MQFPEEALARTSITIVLILTINVAIAAAPRSENENPATDPMLVRFGPIGTAYSLSQYKLDRRSVQGETSIWGNETLEACDGRLDLTLNSVGRLTLSPRSVARVSVAKVAERPGHSKRVVVIKWICGRLEGSLEQTALAYVEGNVRGFEPRENHFVVDANSIANMPEPRVNVQPEPIWIEPMDPRGQPLGRSHRTMKVRKNNIRLVKVKAFFLEGEKKGMAAVGRTLLFVLSNGRAGSIGSQSTTAVTDQFGVAEATFTAGPNEESTDITVSDGEPHPHPRSESWTGTIQVTGAFWLFRTRNIALIGASTAGTICIFKCGSDSKPPLTQVPPPMIP